MLNALWSLLTAEEAGAYVYAGMLILVMILIALTMAKLFG